MTITSLENDKVKKCVRLKTKKYRDLEGLFLVEGLHLVEEAYKANLIDEIILIEGETCSYHFATFYVTKDVMKKLTMMETPSAIMAICHKRKMSPDLGNHLLLLDEIQDPGNLGTMIRSSKAFGIDSLVLGEGCVDLYNPKVLRSTQGMAFHMNIITRDLKELIKELKQKGIPIYGTHVDKGVNAYQLKKEEKENYALIMGNEGNGVHEELLALCDQYITIPIHQEVESLNVSVAASILLYELNRR